MPGLRRKPDIDPSWRQKQNQLHQLKGVDDPMLLLQKLHVQIVQELSNVISQICQVLSAGANSKDCLRSQVATMFGQLAEHV